MCDKTIKDIWLNKNGLELEIRIDWANDRHHLIVIDRPCSVDNVVKALHRAAAFISYDEHLKTDARDSLSDDSNDEPDPASGD